MNFASRVVVVRELERRITEDKQNLAQAIRSLLSDPDWELTLNAARGRGHRKIEAPTTQTLYRWWRDQRPGSTEPKPAKVVHDPTPYRNQVVTEMKKRSPSEVLADPSMHETLIKARDRDNTLPTLRTLRNWLNASNNS